MCPVSGAGRPVAVCAGPTSATLVHLEKLPGPHEKRPGAAQARASIVQDMLTADTLREAFSHFPQGIVLLAAEVDGAPHALIASTFTVGVSLDPPLVSVAVQHSSQTWPVLRARPRLGVTLLGREQSGIARQLASSNREGRFTGVGFDVDDAGALTLHGAPAWMTTQVHDTMHAGDHDMVLLEVLTIDSTPGEQAMVFHRSAFKELSARDLPA